MDHQMNLRRSDRIRKPARREDEDDQEDLVTEDRNNKDFESAITAGDLIPDYKKRVPLQKVEVKLTQVTHKNFMSPSTYSDDGPSDRQPSFDSQGYLKKVGIFCVCLIVLILLQEPFYGVCNEKYQRSDCSEDFYKLSQEYPQLKTFWKNINVTYKVCSKSDSPGVILVLHNGNGDVANCIVNRTASLLSRSLKVHPAGEFLHIDGRTALVEYGQVEFLSSVMEQRQKFGVVVFSYLEQIDSGLVKDLHFICDKDPNINDKAIIILVVKVETQSFENRNLDDMANRRIKDLWGNTLGDRLQPIIGRITNIVESIDENIMSKCF